MSSAEFMERLNPLKVRSARVRGMGPRIGNRAALIPNERLHLTLFIPDTRLIISLAYGPHSPFHSGRSECRRLYHTIHPTV
jgi:hypothetical protein